MLMPKYLYLRHIACVFGDFGKHGCSVSSGFLVEGEEVPSAMNCGTLKVMIGQEFRVLVFFLTPTT